MKRITTLMLAAAFLFLAVTTVTAEDKLETIVNKLQKNYDDIIDFSAKFNQVTEAKFLGAPAIQNGEVFFKKPGKFRKHIGSIADDTFSEDLITNGKTLWYYRPNEKQVIIYDSGEALENEFFLPFLFGEGKLTENFEVAMKESTMKEAKNSYLMALVPKEPDTGVEWILLVIDKDTFLIKQMNIYSVTKSVIRIAFEDIKINQGLSDSFFNFQVPSGVEIIRKKIEYSGPPETKVDVKILENDD
ncbi:MAG: outer membrane lipoprotein carrier protein LolA [Deltaproteobacteria bacterium]|uniref:Outer membrane lipoprotein carrier protein LolA n=1 Tax=Candidatus Zymogenus saltonus TaxID=2844893 RepID=A0A9D8PRX0_9DELT|nr:outer membrane lipoprotein carrier protein LolA [Candidatus Zymogenus saltonus]